MRRTRHYRTNNIFLASDFSESLVVKRSLHTTTNKEEPCLKHNIFHTFKNFQGRFVISSKIMVAMKMSCKLNFRKIKVSDKEKPHPYKLQWLNKDNEVKASQCFLVSFSIGTRYKDKACMV